MSSVLASGNMLVDTCGEVLKPSPSPLVKRGVRHALELRQSSKQKMKELVEKVELSASPYDTAWVALVPSGQNPEPRFPQCLNWIMENQQPDGSWAFDQTHPLLLKDSLSSTLACILALRRWNHGEKLVSKGLDFISSNKWATFDNAQHSPVGFDITFPGMVQSGLSMGLNLPFHSSSLDGMLRKREDEIQRLLRSGSVGKEAYLAYLAEGLSKNADWKSVMKYQRKNGSIFNSPSATAASLLHVEDDNSSMYLNSLLQRYGSSVPTIYPLDIHTRLCVVDNLVSLGIDEHFTDEIKAILDETYRYWVDGDEEIFLDIPCLAMAFRQLRMNGYDVSSETLSGLEIEEQFFDSVGVQFQNPSTILELFKASILRISPNEPVLEKMNEWTTSYLKQALQNKGIHDNILKKEVEYHLKYAHARVGRLESRKTMELYQVDNVRQQKTAYRCLNVDDKQLLQTSVQDFNMYSSIQRKELLSLERWVKDQRIDQLNYPRERSFCGYFAITSVIPSPEFMDARCSWTKSVVLVTILDDFFDFAGSEEEQRNLVELIDKWGNHHDIGFCSEQVEIIFSAICDIVDEYSEKGSERLGWNVRSHFIQSWHEVVQCMRREAVWATTGEIPTMEEYLYAGNISIALGPPFVGASYFLGSPLSEEAAFSQEYKDLLWHTRMVVRLLNDYMAVEREREQGKLNSVALLMVKNNYSEEEAQKETTRVIDNHRSEILRLVQTSEGSVVPRECKDLYWKVNNVHHIFYLEDDAFTSQDAIMGTMKSIFEPVHLPSSSPIDDLVEAEVKLQ